MAPQRATSGDSRAWTSLSPGHVLLPAPPRRCASPEAPPEVVTLPSQLSAAVAPRAEGAVAVASPPQAPVPRLVQVVAPPVRVVVPVLKRSRLVNPPQRVERPASVSPPPKRVGFSEEALAKAPRPFGHVPGVLLHPLRATCEARPEELWTGRSKDRTPYLEDGIIVGKGGGSLLPW